MTRVNPYALRVIEEAGIDWSGARSKSITEFLDQTFDYVITNAETGEKFVSASTKLASLTRDSRLTTLPETLRKVLQTAVS